MVQTSKIEEIGLRQARQICQMTPKQRATFLAEGLPIVFQSARSLMEASRALSSHRREAEILEGHATEESAKLIILIDILRCPPKLIAGRLGNMIRWFYDHQSRLIYASAQSWVAYSPSMLQGYVDNSRKTYYLEGGCGEYIMPNWDTFLREATLYADVIGNEDAAPSWNSPHSMSFPDMPNYEPTAFRIVDALDAVGALSEAGSKIVNEVWGRLDFSQEIEEWGDTRQASIEMLERLEAASLVTDRAQEEHARILIHRWQKPMYAIDFSPINVTLDELRQLRDAIFYNEFI